MVKLWVKEVHDPPLIFLVTVDTTSKISLISSNVTKEKKPGTNSKNSSYAGDNVI